LVLSCEIKEIKRLGKTAFTYDAQEIPQVDTKISETAYFMDGK
jgi:hypothetical protein